MNNTTTTYDLTPFLNSDSNSEVYEALPEDRYNLEIETAEHQESKNKPGTFYISTRMVVTDGKFKNRKVWHIFSTSPKAMVFIANLFKASENTAMLQKTGITGDQLAAAMVGTRFSAMVLPGTNSKGNPTSILDVKTIAPVVNSEEDYSLVPPPAPKASSKSADIFA